MNPIVPEARAPRALSIEFTASGSEYFRIWIVNLLFVVLTLGLYLPFAKARRLRYFYANTRVDGQALAFHGDPWKMFRGFLLMLALFGAYAASDLLSPWLTLAVFILIAALWPALWRSSLRFRCANTSWRGLRFGFEGTLADAYRVMLPWFVPGVVVLLLTAAWVVEPGLDAEGRRIINAKAQLWVSALSAVLVLVCFPLGLARSKRYQHQGYRYAAEQTDMALGNAAFYKLGIKTLVLLLLTVVCAGLLLGVLAPMFGALAKGRSVALMASVMVGMGILYAVLFSFLLPYYTARLQNLCWNATRSDHLQFHSELGVRALAKLTLQNWLLVLLTLGGYRPFAVVRTQAMRLQAMRIDVDGDVADWLSLQVPAGANAATGEMAGDFFGFDLGL